MLDSRLQFCRSSRLGSHFRTLWIWWRSKSRVSTRGGYRCNLLAITRAGQTPLFQVGYLLTPPIHKVFHSKSLMPQSVLSRFPSHSNVSHVIQLWLQEASQWGQRCCSSCLALWRQGHRELRVAVAWLSQESASLLQHGVLQTLAILGSSICQVCSLIALYWALLPDSRAIIITSMIYDMAITYAITKFD